MPRCASAFVGVVGVAGKGKVGSSGNMCRRTRQANVGAGGIRQVRSGGMQR